MSAQEQNADPVVLPSLPAKHSDWVSYAASHPDTPMSELIGPYKDYDSKLRQIFAQQPQHPAASEPNVVPVFTGSEEKLKIRARDLAAESEAETQHYLMPLKDADRKPNGSPAVVQSLKTFQTNFQLFSESSLVDMDWSNVVVAGSAVVTALLPVPDEHNASKRSLREYYHQKLAPASDVDLFLYDLTEEQAIEKIKQIEQRIKDSILTETTTVRTKNAITIASQYPTRHVQIVLRLYQSVSEILTGFDVDCACAAYDGKQVYASPRALAAYMTQINTVDLTRRSPSYENRLSKYSRRGFEIYWSLLDRSRIDPTIFERSFGRTLGLARLLVLEKLPKNTDREAYVDQRRAERGRPAINRWNSRSLPGNMKEEHDDEVAEWVETDEVSDYNTFTIPYGLKYHARKIERLLYAKDLLLNAEWNRPKERETNLHRHPAFFGSMGDVIGDCCGYCPKPASDDDEDIAKEESKTYVSGDLTFIKDDPGRQAIGSFRPLTDDDWTEMAYVGNTARLCQAIVDGDLEGVQDWLSQEGANPDTRDYTGRTPLQLAVTSSTPEIVQCLIDAGARIVARIVDGKTALHLAAMRGEAAMVKAILTKSEANEEMEAEKEVQRKASRKETEKGDDEMVDVATSQLEASNIESASVKSDEGSDVDMLDDETDNVDATTEDSIIRVDQKSGKEHEHLPDDADKDEPDVYDVNVLAWDTPVSPLHLAIAHGHTEVVKVLVQDFGADVLLPVKLLNQYNKSPRAAILPLVLGMELSSEKAEEMVKLLISLGASPAQADLEHITALQYCILRGVGVLEAMISANRPAAQRAAGHLSMSGWEHNPNAQSVLRLAIERHDIAAVDALLEVGAKAEVDYATYMTSYKTRWTPTGDAERNQKQFKQNFYQPILSAVEYGLPAVVLKLVSAGADVNTLTTTAWATLHGDSSWGNNTGVRSLLDTVRDKIKEQQDVLENKGDEDTSYYSHWYYDPRLPPPQLKDDSEYLNDLEPASYSYWSATKQLEDAKTGYEKNLKQHKEWLEKQKAPDLTEEKKNAAKTLLAGFEDVESKLLELGAKTFKELHPDTKIEEAQQYHHNSSNEPRAQIPWAPKITFQLPELTDEQCVAYIRLFEACWSGDLPTVKELTLAIWNDNQSPLKIAVEDNSKFSPFSIAILRKHFDVAKAVLEIAHAQYAPEENEGKAKYSIQPADSDGNESISENDDQIQIYSEIVDDRFTVENIGEVQSQVKSNVTPLKFLSWDCPVSRFFEDDDPSVPNVSGSSGSSSSYRHRWNTGGESLRSSGRDPSQVLKHARNMRTYHVATANVQESIVDAIKPGNVFQLAIYLDDPELLHFLIAMGEDYSRSRGDIANESLSKFFCFNEQDFLFAIRLGRVQLLDEIVKRTGAGIPLDDLVKTSGVQVAETPKYYQGLSVHGKKREDWANAGRDNAQSPQEQHPPLLHAGRLGSIESVEWFMSDAPSRCYVDFAENHRDDKRIQNLAKAKGGVQGAISTWLNLRSKLLIHCVVLGTTTQDSLNLLQHLCKNFPDLLEQKSDSGLTPLHLACSLHRTEMIKVLLAAGADQTCRNQTGDNILHSLLTKSVVKPEKIRSLLSLVDTRLLPSLFSERTSTNPGAATPLARWLFQFCQPRGTFYNDREDAEEMLGVILEFSKGEDLSIINGEGDSPPHAAVRYAANGILRIMLDCRPELLYRENGTGRTPYEMAEGAYFSKGVFNDPPMLPGNDNWNRHQNRYFQTNTPPQLSDTEEVWDVCEEFAQKAGATKRKLVSLMEANEVAKRLASRQANRIPAGYPYTNVNADDGTKKDEVTVWYDMAQYADKDLDSST